MKPKLNRRLLIVGILVSLFIGWIWWGNTAIQVNQVNISSKKIVAALEGFRVVQVSDLHNAEFGINQTTLVNAVNQASPDVIAITGDLIDSGHTNVSAAMEFINAAVKIAPVYFVTGNHEAWSRQYPELKRQMILAGVLIMDDEKRVVNYNGAVINFLGLNDPDFIPEDADYERAARIDTVLKDLTSLNNNEFTILLSHRPELFDVYVEHKIDLVLSGHAHGGQFRLPLIGGLVAPDQGLFPKYSAGLYRGDLTQMVVSRGLGNSIIPLRVNNRPDLVIITLTNQ